jgi:CRP-like cAMP-binding protein
LFSEGQSPERALILLEGQVTLSVNSEDGKRLTIGIAKPGEILGLASVLNGCAYEMVAEARFACEISAIDRLKFLRFLLRHPSALKDAALLLGQSYNQACERLRTLSGFPTSRAKIARLLLEFSTSNPQGGSQFHLALNHQEIGEWVGMSRESVSRALSDFRRVNLIEQNGACIAIKDPSSLKRIASECRSDRKDVTGNDAPSLEGTDDESIENLIEHVTAVLERHKIRLPRLKGMTIHASSPRRRPYSH